jgi:tRNA-modifying protein YgfZ
MDRIIRHHGEPAAEYAAARDDAGVIERGDRALVRVHGRDPVRMVQGLVTNDVAGAAADRAVYAALLTPKGRMLADLRIIRAADELLLECAAAALDNVLATMRRYVPPLFAKFEDISATWHVLGVHGPRADEVVRAALGDAALPSSTLEDSLAGFAPSADAGAAAGGSAVSSAATAWAVRTRYAGDHGLDIIAPREPAARMHAALVRAGARPFGHAALDVLRIEAGSPRWGAELTEETIPLEADLFERAISTTKGCYTGQEVIVRILHRGHVNWHLRGVLLGDVPAPAQGSEIVHPDTGKRVGRITSACASPRHDQTIALAYVRRELELPVEARLASVDGAAVSIVTLPFPASDLGGAPLIGASS